MPTGEPFSIESSELYQFRQAERAEIERNKWLLSEKAGCDVGWDYAQWNWIWCHRQKWLDGLKAEGKYPLR
jgi:hypothetical protein